MVQRNEIEIKESQVFVFPFKSNFLMKVTHLESACQEVNGTIQGIIATDNEGLYWNGLFYPGLQIIMDILMLIMQC